MMDSIRKAQFAVMPMWAHRRIVATRTRTIAHAVYIELVGQYAGSAKDSDGLRVWPEVQQIADSLGVPKSSVVRALAVLIDCGVVLRKRTMRRNQYWLPQEDPGEFTATLAEFQSVTSDTLRSVTSDTLRSVTSDTLRSVTSDTLYNPVPYNPDPNNPTLFVPPAPTSPQDPPVGSAPPTDDVRREDVELVCTTLANAIEANGSLRPTITNGWRTSARLLIDRDHRTVEQILKAIDWSQNDDFWRRNILSMPTLRKQYDRLRLAAISHQAGGRTKHQPYQNPDDHSGYYESF